MTTNPRGIDYDSWLYSGPGGPHDDTPIPEEEEMKCNPNDPAFPSSGLLGLTTREYFAGLALQGFLAMHADSSATAPMPSKTAIYCVEYADALITELNKE